MRDGYTGMSHMELSGWQQDNVITPDEVVSGSAEVGKNVVVWDGRADITGAGVAEMLADRGCNVVVVAPHPMLGGIEALLDQTWFHFMPRLLNKGVEVSISTFPVMLVEKTLTVLNTHTMAMREIPADTLVVITGKNANDGLYKELQGKVSELYKVGDARNPHTMGEANRDGHFVGRLL